MPIAPSAEVIQRVQAGFVEIYSRVDIYEADTTTLWYADAPVIEGSVSVDQARDERRTASLVIANETGLFKSRPGGFWYDKVFKLYRGIRGHINYLQDDGSLPIYDSDVDTIEDETFFTDDWETQIGEFFIDDIDAPSFPLTSSVTMRDGSKKLLESKFAESTEFLSGVSIESVVQAVAFGGGIPLLKMNLPITGVNIERDFLFDRGTERWKAIKEVCEAYNHEVFFDYTGDLTIAPYEDPADPGASPSVFTFEVGGRGVRNGSFEEVNPLNGEPDWWYEVATGAPVFEVEDGGQQFSDDRAVLIRTPTGADGGGVYSASIPVEPGWVFRIAAWSKATVEADGKYIRAMFRVNEGDAWSASALVVNNGDFTFEYEEDEGEVTVPAGVSWMDIRLDNWTGTAKTAWYDEVTVERLYPVDDTKGNIVTFGKKTSSSRIYNHISVTGESTNSLPVTAEATNTEPTSPTRIAALGVRTFPFTSAFITNETQAQEVADRLLKIHALESFEVALESIVCPWLEPGQIVTFIDPEAAPTDPVRYLLSNLTIPLKPAAMSANAKRVTIVG